MKTKLTLLSFRIFFVIMYVSSSLLFVQNYSAEAKFKIPLDREKAEIYTVARAVDGDTVVLSNGERVRLIGVDTPESRGGQKLNKDAERTHQDKELIKALGRKAKAFTKGEIEGRKVRLEYDWQRQDRYGRTLAYVFRVPDDFFLNAEIIKQGYGNAYTRFPFKYLDEFRQYEREAREGRRGLWR